MLFVIGWAILGGGGMPRRYWKDDDYDGVIGVCDGEYSIAKFCIMDVEMLHCHDVNDLIL